MDPRYSFEIDQRLKQLAARRARLEKKSTLRQATIAEFDIIRQESLSRLCDAVEHQNQQAKMRNRALLEDVTNTAHLTQWQSGKPIRVTANNIDRLKEAKREYIRKKELNLPEWQRMQTLKFEQKMEEMKLEKIQSLQRRERLKEEIRRTERIKTALEMQRRDLLSSLVLEQKYALEANAHNILLQEESNTINREVMMEVSAATSAMQEALQREVRNIQHESIENQKDRIADRNTKLMKWPWLSSHENMENKVKLGDNGFVKFQAGQIDLEKFNKELEEERKKAFFGIKENSSNLSNSGNSGRNDENVIINEFEKEEKQSYGFSDQSSRLSGLDSTDDPKISTKIQAIPESQKESESDDEFGFGSIGSEKIISRQPDSSFQNVSNIGLLGGSIVNSEGILTIQTASEEKENSKISERDLALTKAPSEQLTISSNETRKLSIDESGGLLAFDRKDRDSSYKEKIDPMASPVLDRTNPSANSSHLVTQADGDGSPMELVRELRLNQCSDFLKTITDEVMARVQDNDSRNSTGLKDFYSIASGAQLPVTLWTDVKSCLQGLIRENSGELEGNEFISREENSVLGAAVLCIVQTRAPELIPLEAFSGVVTLEKLKKEQQKIPGSVQFWNVLAEHLQNLVAFNYSYLSFLSICFTGTLVAHVELEERERLHRKVSKLLQLALIPPEKTSPERVGSAEKISFSSKDNKPAENTNINRFSNDFVISPKPQPVFQEDRYQRYQKTETDTVDDNDDDDEFDLIPSAPKVTGSPSLNKTIKKDLSNHQYPDPPFNTGDIKQSPTTSESSPTTGVKSTYDATKSKFDYGSSNLFAGKNVSSSGNSGGGFNYGKGLDVGASISKVAELEDDEIEDDESIEAPPPIRVLDEIHSSPDTAVQTHQEDNQGDEYDDSLDYNRKKVQNDWSGQGRSYNDNNNNYNRSSNKNTSHNRRRNEYGSDDEFDF